MTRRRRDLVGNLEIYSRKGGSNKRRRGRPFHVPTIRRIARAGMFVPGWRRIVGSVRRKGRRR